MNTGPTPGRVAAPPKAPRPAARPVSAAYQNWGAGIARALGLPGNPAPNTFQYHAPLPGQDHPVGGPAATGAPARPPAAPPPAQPPAAPAPALTGAADQGSPLDAAYYNQVAQFTAKANDQLNALGLKDATANTTLQDTLGQLAYAQPRAALALEQKYNRNGGLFSSVEAQGEGDLANSYLTKQNTAQNRYGNTIAADALTRGNLQAELDPNSPQMLAYALASAIRQGKIASSLPAPPPPAPPAYLSNPSSYLPAPNGGPSVAASNAGALSQLAPGSSHPLTTTTGQRYQVSTSPSGQVSFKYQGSAKPKGKK